MFLGIFLYKESNSRRYQCDVCSRSYSWKGGLSQHKRYQCGKEPQFICPVEGCNHKSAIKGNLKQHLLAVHKDL